MSSSSTKLLNANGTSVVLSKNQSSMLIGLILMFVFIYAIYSHYQVYKYRSWNQVPTHYKWGNYLFYAFVIVLVILGIMSLFGTSYSIDAIKF